MQENVHPLIVGRISGVYGVRGWLKIVSYTRPKENILSYSPWLIRVNNVWQDMDVEESQQRGGGRLIAKMSGIDNPDEAGVYINCDLAIPREQLAPLSEGEYYWHDLIGLDVFNQDGISLGQVKELIETGANDVLVINGAGDDKTRILIPLVMGVYVKQVDLIAKTLHVDWQIEE